MRRKMLVLSWLIGSVLVVVAHAQTDSFPAFQGLASSALIQVTPEVKQPAKQSLSLFIFLSPECPLCQNYSKVIRQLNEQYHTQVNFYGIFPGAAYSKQDIRNFEQQFRTGVPMFIDKEFQFTRYVKAAVTPQAILLDESGSLLYSGAIDDWMIAQGKKRIKASNHYLEDALQQILFSGTVKVKRTKAVGCKINDY